jgi:hypothetical protein
VPDVANAKEPAPAFPRHGWLAIALAAILAGAAVLASRWSPAGWAIIVAVACAAVGALLAWWAQRTALSAHARLPMLAAGVLLGFFATAVLIAFITTMLIVLSPRG